MANKSNSTGAIPKSKSTLMQKEISHIDGLTSKYWETLHKEIQNIENEQKKLSAEIRKINDLMDQLKQLSEQPEWPNSFIQVNPLAYIPATIEHTGEHYVKLGPEIYTLMSLKETLGFLQRKIDRVQEILDGLKVQKQQLEERCLFSNETTLEVAGTQDMPVEITSDKGVAHKTAVGFYEVVEEYNEEDEKEFYKNRLQCKSRKGKVEVVETSPGDYFEKLDKLQKQEDLKGELGDEQIGLEVDTNDQQSISVRIKLILQKSGVYNYLLEDELVRQHCYEHKTALEIETDAKTTMRNESVLNELIVEALINEPVYSINDDINDCSIESAFTDDSLHNVSSNDLATSAYLDSIENDFKNWRL